MRAEKANYPMVFLGLLLLAGGLYLVKTAAVPQGMMRALPYVCIGLGCGLFGQGLGGVLGAWALRGSPGRAKELVIAQRDERNLAIAGRAKGKAFDAMTYVFGALMLAFALMGVDMAAVLLLVSAYLLVHGISIYYHIRLEKEM